MQYITVTTETDTLIRINVDMIESWGSARHESYAPHGTRIRYAGEMILVKESPEEIEQKIDYLAAIQQI